MKRLDRVFQDFVDAIELARNDVEFERTAARTTVFLGFRWFAYLRIVEGAPKLISCYPRSWSSRYFDLHYQQLDPVIRRARLDHDLFGWASGAAAPGGTKDQRRFFEEAVSFGIRCALLLGISPRTVAFHLENAKRKLDATSIAQCVAEAIRRRLLT